MNNIIHNFYSAFAMLDSEEMVKYYHPDVEFHDPAFGSLKGEQAKNMWRMLCHSQKGKNFKVRFEVLNEFDNQANAKWEALYIFSQTGRKVHNQISASFVIKDGLIIKHTDQFNLYNWSQQALGLKGYLIGFTPFFRKQLQKKTNAMLVKFEAASKNKSD